MDGSIQNSPHIWAYSRKYQQRTEESPAKVNALRQSVKRVSKEYCEESSICGLKHLVDERTPWLERIIWIVTLVGALICSVSLVWLTFQKYYKSPLVTTQMPEGVSVSKIIFPAVGICSNNRISKRAVTQLAEELLTRERNKNYTLDQMLDLLMGLGQFYNPNSFLDIDSLQVHHILDENYNVYGLLESLTPRCKDLLVRCSWNDRPKDCHELFDFRLTTNGYCCTFNYLRESDTLFTTQKSGSRSIDMYKYGNKSFFDYDMGLRALMRFNESDDFYYNVPLRGAQLQFSNAYDFPDAPSGSFAMQVISPDVQMSVMVTASLTEASRDIQHIAVNLRQCLFYDESSYLTFYTHSDCMLKCRMLFLLDKCQCTPFNILKLNTSRTCDLRDVPCLRQYFAQSISVSPDVEHIPPELELDLVGGGVSCPMCFPTCSKTAYNYDFNNVDIYPDYLNSIPDYDRDEWLREADFTGTSLVHVKYGSEVADCYGQNVIMKWFDLISNIGSTCGFVTGFSFVSVLEFIYFFTVKLIREIILRRQKRHVVGPFDPQTPKQFGSMGKFRPIYWNEISGNRPDVTKGLDSSQK